MTQAELARTLGCSQQQVVSFEKGRRRIQVTQLPDLSAALGVSLEELLGKGRSGKRSRLQQQIELLSRLPRSEQRVVLKMLDGVLQKAG